MRRLLPIVFALVSGSATTNAAENSGAELVAKGIYSSTGNRTYITDTTIIPAVLGTHFGIAFQVRAAALHNVFVPATITWRFPAAGISNPKSGQTSRVSSIKTACWTYKDCHAGWKFEQPWELVPGVWEVEIVVDNRTVLKQSFTVVEP
jgi:hypothetical protein